MSIPSLSTLQKIAVESYNPKAKDNVDGWILVDETPTLKFYMRGFDTVVGVRGTFDAADTSADAMIATGRLESSNRFKEDLKVMTDYANSHKQTNIFGVGHSLGGAIMDSLIKKGLIKEGVSYNPAVQPQDFRSILPNRRIYMSGDPLYAIFGNFLRQRPEVRKSKTSFFSKLGLKSVAPEYLKSHGLAEFEGGKRGGNHGANIVAQLINLVDNYNGGNYRQFTDEYNSKLVELRVLYEDLARANPQNEEALIAEYEANLIAARPHIRLLLQRFPGIMAEKEENERSRTPDPSNDPDPSAAGKPRKCKKCGLLRV